MTLHCISCGKEAEYIFMVLGTGGSYCKECLEKKRKGIP